MTEGTPIHSTTTVPIDKLEHYPGNARRGDLDALTESLQHHGQYRPIVANKNTDQVLAGNHTLAAARHLGWTELAVTWVDVDEDQARRIVLVDNRTNDLATYDDQALADLLTELDDLVGTGYTTDALNELLANLTPDEPALTDPDDVPPEPNPPISEEGDVWLLGPHRLVCGDGTDPEVVTTAMGGGCNG